jgi:hypothetical protein
MCRNSLGFDQQQEIEFVKVMERAYFFFGDDIQDYLRRLNEDIITVRTADSRETATLGPRDLGQMLERRQAALLRIGEFYRTGQPLFGRYMRFSQTKPARVSAKTDP